MLEELGYTVLATSMPSEALQLAHESAGRIDLLLTDVIMPEMNGKELTGELTQRFPELKCLFMSGYSGNLIARQGVLDEGVHFLQKPFSQRQLAVKVREALS